MKTTYHPVELCKLCDSPVEIKSTSNNTLTYVDHIKVPMGTSGEIKLHVLCVENTIKARLREDKEFRETRETYINKQFSYWKKKKEFMDNTKWREVSDDK